PLQGSSQLAAPRDGDQEQGDCLISSARAQSFDELAHVRKQPSISRRVAAPFLIHARAAAVQKGNLEAGLAQLPARILIPAGMALNAVQANEVGAGRRNLGSGTRRVTAIAPAITVRCRK